MAGEFIACALFAMLAWNIIVPPRESHDILGHTQSLGRGGPGPDMIEVTRNDAMCPTYTQQVIGDSSYLPQHNGNRGSFNGGGAYIETRPYFDPNGQTISGIGNISSSYYTPRDKRGSTQTLSTISEVRRPSSSSFPSRNSIETGGRRATSCGGEFAAAANGEHASLPSPFWKRTSNHHSSQPPPSATESVKSHWSDDSEDDKKGFAVVNLVKSTRDSLTRKSSKGSRTSSN